MTDTNNTDPFSPEADAILDAATTRLSQARALLADIEKARDEQPELLAQARSEADEARGWALIEEPWHTLITALPAHDAHGKRTGGSLTLPSITAKELFGARLAFDMLDAGEDHDRLEEVKNRYFSELKGDTGLLFLVFAAALDTVASLVVPQMLEDLENRASNYDARVLLAQARTKAWNGRVSELSGPHDLAAGDDQSVVEE